jgi:hypothetical protein
MIIYSGKVKFEAFYKVSTETYYIQAVNTDYCFIEYWVTDYILTIVSDEFDVSLLATESFSNWIKLQCETIKDKF